MNKNMLQPPQSETAEVNIEGALAQDKRVAPEWLNGVKDGELVDITQENTFPAYTACVVSKVPRINHIEPRVKVADGQCSIE